MSHLYFSCNFLNYPVFSSFSINYAFTESTSLYKTTRRTSLHRYWLSSWFWSGPLLRVHRDAQLYAKDWNFNIKDIKKKIFVWHGKSDLTVPVTISKYYKTKLKNKKIYIKSNEGHFSICYNFINDIIQQVSA